MKLLLLLFLATDVFGQAELIGGKNARQGDFPEVIYISAGRSRCTATVVGPRVILTAAHCVADEGEIRPVTFSLAEGVFRAKCKQSPLYRDKEEDHDIALCKTDRDVSTKYASVSLKPPSIGDRITLSGYGCIKQGGGGGNDGQLRYGEATVTRTPNGKNNWFYTKGSSALCFGDSGGPAFHKINNPQTEHHFIAGVNSRGNIKDLSLLTSLAIGKTVSFMRKFEQDFNVAICGLKMKCFNEKPDCKNERRRVRYYSMKLQEWSDRLKKCMG